jgi:glycosyltransferase involved in cell wall biosynthesis
LGIVVGIPAFNEEVAIAKVIIRSQKYAQKVVVVDDGSSDDTGLISKSLGAAVLRHDRNLGKGAALRDLFRWAKQNGADVLVTIDGDGQHDATKIPLFIDALESNGADVVLGGRQNMPPDMTRIRWIGVQALNRVTHVKVNGRVVDAQSGFRAYSRRAIETLAPGEIGMAADSEILMRADRMGMCIVEIPISIKYAGLDTSTHHPVTQAVDVLFSVLKFISIRHPLSFYGGFGLCALAVSIWFGLMTLNFYQRWGIIITNLALITVATGIVAFLSLFTGLILFTLITVGREAAH